MIALLTAVISTFNLVYLSYLNLQIHEAWFDCEEEPLTSLGKVTN